MTYRRFILSLLMLLCAICHAGLTGDLNGDGKLDVADLERLYAMKMGRVVTDLTLADLDFDGKLSSADEEILLGLVRGTYEIPQALEAVKDVEVVRMQDRWGDWKDVQMGYYEGAGFKVSWPWKNYGEDLSFWTVDELPESPLPADFPGKLSPAVGISNLVWASDMSIVLDVPEDMTGIPALLVGAKVPVKGDHDPLWSYQVVHVDGENLILEDNKLIWKLERYSNRVSDSAPLLLSVVSLGTSDTRGGSEMRGDTGWDDLGIEFNMQSGSDGFVWYTTTHFSITPPVLKNYPLSQMQRLARNLEKAYRVIGGLGFKQTFPYLWGRISVNIHSAGEGEAEDAYCTSPDLFFAPRLVFGEGVLTSDRIGSILIHELMHYHHYNYATCYGCLWLEEMCTTWSERLMADDPESYLPTTYHDPRAVLDGLPMESTKPTIFTASAASEKNRAASDHGYNLYPFAVWLTRKYPAEELWYRVFSSHGYEIDQPLTALKQAIWALDGDADLGDLYVEFVREYFDSKRTIPFPRAEMSPFNCFQSSDAVRFANNGKKTLVKTAGDLFMQENIEHTFKMPQLGTATWLYTFEQGTDEFMRNYNEVLIKAKTTQYDFFVLRFENGKFSLTAPEEVQVNEEKNVSTIRLPLSAIGISDRRTAFGIVAINHNFDEYNAASAQDITLSLSFSGPLIVSVTGEMPYEELLNGYWWAHEYTKVKSELTFTPLGDTTFVDSSVMHALEMGPMGVRTVIPIVTTHLATAEIPDTLEINITGTIEDIPVPMFKHDAEERILGWSIFRPEYMWTEASGYFKIEAYCSGHKLDNFANKKDDGSFSFDEDIHNGYFTSEGVGAWNPIVGGMAYTAEDIQPSGPKGLSHLTITFPEVDKNATQYTINIMPHYLEYITDDERYLAGDASYKPTSRHNFNSYAVQLVILLK